MCAAQLSGACLSYTLESGALHPSGSLDMCLGIPDGKYGLSPGAYPWGIPLCRHGCSGHMFVLVTWLFWSHLWCVSLPDVSSMI